MPGFIASGFRLHMGSHAADPFALVSSGTPKASGVPLVSFQIQPTGPCKEKQPPGVST